MTSEQQRLLRVVRRYDLLKELDEVAAANDIDPTDILTRGPEYETARVQWWARLRARPVPVPLRIIRDCSGYSVSIIHAAVRRFNQSR